MAQKWLRYCRLCVLPETRPNTGIDADGVCKACRNFEDRHAIDWEKRKKELLQILERYRSKNGNNYDCIVPVSGGKDSHYQVYKMLELGMKPLCVYAAVDKPSQIGRRNLENMKALGVDCVEVSTNPIVRNRINKFTLMEIGDISWAENVAIFTIPVRIAVQMKIPLLIWGENPENEYGGPAAEAHNNILDKRWLDTFGGLLGLSVGHVQRELGLSEQDILQFTYPGDKELKEIGVTGLFLGYYFPWDAYAHALLAQGLGFEMWPKSAEGALVNYEHMDNLHAGIHDYLKYLKFGFSRTTDHACVHTRRERLTRHEALDIVKRKDGRFPSRYLEVTLDEILRDINMTMEEFHATCDKFTNKALFQCDSSGKLLRRPDGSPDKINWDNVEEIPRMEKKPTSKKHVVTTPVH